MNNLLGNHPHVLVYFDDILVTGNNDEDHSRNVSQILKRLQDACLRLKLAKCKLMKDRVEYLEQVITVESLHPSPKDIAAIFSAPRP
ncbi:hypothetical protein MTO96_049372 [Rhipicephalus appendiculatus]